MTQTCPQKIMWKHCPFMVHNNLAWNLPKPEMKRGSIYFPPQTLKSLHGTHSCNWQSQDYKNMPSGVSGQNDWIVPTDESKPGCQIIFSFHVSLCMRGDFHWILEWIVTPLKHFNDILSGFNPCEVTFPNFCLHLQHCKWLCDILTNLNTHQVTFSDFLKSPNCYSSIFNIGRNYVTFWSIWTHVTWHSSETLLTCTPHSIQFKTHLACMLDRI